LEKAILRETKEESKQGIEEIDRGSAGSVKSDGGTFVVRWSEGDIEISSIIFRNSEPGGKPKQAGVAEFGRKTHAGKSGEFARARLHRAFGRGAIHPGCQKLLGSVIRKNAKGVIGEEEP
jgi:hypothetical protein